MAKATLPTVTGIYQYAKIHLLGSSICYISFSICGLLKRGGGDWVAEGGFGWGLMRSSQPIFGDSSILFSEVHGTLIAITHGGE